MEYRVDFFLDEPLFDAKALDDLARYTESHKAYFGLPQDVDVLWIKSMPHNFYEQVIQNTFAKIRSAISSPTQTIILWAAEYNFVPDENLVKSLNEFSRSIQNPIIFVNGMLGNWTQQWIGKLDFTLSPLLYFDYEAAVAWDVDVELSNVRSKKFISMGTKDYPNRKFLLSRILTSGIKDDGFVSYAQLNSSGGLGLAHYSSQEISQIQEVAEQANDFLPLPLIDDNPTDWTRMPRNYLTDSYVNMVTDTFYEYHTDMTFLSEKVFNAMIHKQLFFMMSPAHTLTQLRAQGYRTFHDIIDESYDSIENNYQRLVAVTDAFINFVSKPIEEIREIHKACESILEHNRNRVYRKPLPEILLSEIRRAKYEKAQIK